MEGIITFLIPCVILILSHSYINDFPLTHGKLAKKKTLQDQTIKTKNQGTKIIPCLNLVFFIFGVNNASRKD